MYAGCNHLFSCFEVEPGGDRERDEIDLPEQLFNRRTDLGSRLGSNRLSTLCIKVEDIGRTDLFQFTIDPGMISAHYSYSDNTNIHLNDPNISLCTICVHLVKQHLYSGMWGIWGYLV